MEKKNVCKNMTDAAAFVAVIFAVFIIFVAYSSFKPSEETENFYQVTETAVYIGTAGAFLISLIANIASRKSPFIGLAFSLLPIWYLLNCFWLGVLTGRPMLYIILAAVHLAGAIIYTVQWLLDNDHEFSRTVTCGISAGAISLLFFALFILGVKNADYGEPLVYLRGGVIFTSLLCSAAGLLRYSRIDKNDRRLKTALTTVGIGALLSIAALITELAV